MLYALLEGKCRKMLITKNSKSRNSQKETSKFRPNSGRQKNWKFINATFCLFERRKTCLQASKQEERRVFLNTSFSPSFSALFSLSLVKLSSPMPQASVVVARSPPPAMRLDFTAQQQKDTLSQFLQVTPLLLYVIRKSTNTTNFKTQTFCLYGEPYLSKTTLFIHSSFTA